MILDRYAAVTASLSLALICGAQTPITLVSPGNVPVNGTSFMVHQGAYVPPASGGAGILFNFSASTATSSATYQWQDPASLPNGAQFPDAQFALTNAGPDTVFYKETANGLERIGDTQTITALSTPYHFTTVYSDAMLELQLPITFGATPWTDLFAGDFTVDGTAASRNGAINGEADGWGRVIMPGGADTVEVLRVTTRVNETIPLTISGFGVEVNHIRNVRSFYPLWGKFPVLRTVSDSLSSQFLNQNYEFTEWLDASAVGITEATSNPFQVHLFPNPANTRVELGYLNREHGPLTLQVLDVRGAVVLRKELNGYGPAVESIDVSVWVPGIYQAVLTDGTGVRSVQRIAVVR